MSKAQPDPVRLKPSQPVWRVGRLGKAGGQRLPLRQGHIDCGGGGVKVKRLKWDHWHGDLTARATNQERKQV